MSILPRIALHSNVSRAAAALITAALSFVTGCGASEPEPAGPTCEALLPECLSVQMTCAESDGSAQCQPCAGGEYADPQGACQPLAGMPMAHEFTSFDIKAGEEIKGLCQSWTLNNSEELWVNSVEFSQDERSHHSIWTFVPEELFPGPDGVWTCKDRNYNELVGTTSGGVLFAQSTQSTHEVQRFPEGSAIRIPPYSKIVGDIHLLNTTTADIVGGSATMTMYTITKAEVKVPLVPFEMAYRALAIPPFAKSRFSASCELKALFDDVAGSPFDIKIHYILPHTHGYATRLSMQVLGGPSDGASIIDVPGYKEEGRGRFFDTPIDLTGADGISFACDYDNQTDQTLEWAYEQEMCQLLGFAESKVAFLSAVTESAAPVGKDGVQEFTGPCEHLAIPWDFDKPGGMPGQ